MKNLFKLNWINGLGFVFLFTAFLYFLKIAVDYGWFPPGVRAAVGLVLGSSALFAGFMLYKKKKGMWAELLSGLGSAIVYATVAYVSFSDSIILSPNALLISMVAATLITSVVAVKMDMRVLYVIATLGALITPLIIKASVEQDFMLFIYMLIINVAALYVSAIKKWHELKVISFVLSMALYTSYYFLFDPLSWGKPFFYITSLFVVYIVGLTLGSWRQNHNEIGVDQYLGIINAISFVFWSATIFGNFDIPHTVPMVIVGAVFLALGALFYFFKGKKLNVGNGTYLGLGAVVLCIACSDTGLLLGHGMNYVVNSAIWLLLIAGAFFFGKYNKNSGVLWGTYGAFLLLAAYWYMVAWEVEWVTIFGIKYLPFLNAGGLIWMAMAFLGFYFSRFEERSTGGDPSINNALSAILGVVSHIIVGGLLTVQIDNLWDAYELHFLSANLVLSVTWMLYALIIFLWSTRSRFKVYKYMGAAVLVLTSIKVFFWDLSGSATFQKVIFLVVIGLLTLLVGKISTKKKDEDVG
ncbi:MAG: DUF2339 domain-containing protein [Flavobacteriales bacterium]